MLWSAGTGIDAQLIAQFTRDTGISVHLIPASESSSQRLKQESTLLATRSAAVDVLQIDTVWVGQLSQYLIDLRPALEDRIPDELPDTIENATSGGRVTAAPFMVGYGLLFYRTDLLRKYGFQKPPATWDELEAQARRIQEGERRAGFPDFWGYVWQGAAYEGLTCNALEWQYSQGGGNFAIAGPQVNVANRAAVNAFARATGWVGTISPPGVVAYMEEDARNVWQSGNAAFMRNWGYVFQLAQSDSHMAGRFSIAPIPAGSDLHSSVLGGWYLGIPQSSIRQEDALKFVRFMTSRASEIPRAAAGAFLPTLSSAYKDARLQSISPLFQLSRQVFRRAVRRPTAVLGPLYPCVSEIYASGVHDILARKIQPAAGAEKLQSALQNLLSDPERQGCQ